MKPFLTAAWKNLINITYSVDPQRLLPYLPGGLELDTIDGKAFVSFVAFQFEHVCLKGFPVPFHRRFPEINLRFYVRYKGQRGVVFVREYVPKAAVAFVAKKIYNEPYRCIPMRVEQKEGVGSIVVRHEFNVNKQVFYIEVCGNKPTIQVTPDSLEHFFKEHELGFGVDHHGETLAYRVEHPVWELFPIAAVKQHLDFACIYGPEWEFLNAEKPFQTLFAAGSDIKVLSKQHLSELD